MIFQLMSIYDGATLTYSPPFCVRALGQATRDFQSQANDPNSRISHYPVDYYLFHIGTFDDEKCVVAQFEAPRRLACAADFSSAGVGTGMPSGLKADK